MNSNVGGSRVVQSKERPILFSGPMVRAILEGRKTQTRRVVQYKPPPKVTFPLIGRDDKPTGEWFFSDPVYERVGHSGHFCPYGVPGDRPWVRETLRPSQSRVVTYAEDGCPAWRDGESVAWPWPNTPAVRTAIFMPRWASRITLEITDVRVQRLQEISEAEAEAEGIRRLYRAATDTGPNFFSYDGGDFSHNSPTARECFAHLWDSINAKRGFGWDTNPWVWAITFKRVAV